MGISASAKKVAVAGLVTALALTACSSGGDSGDGDPKSITFW